MKIKDITAHEILDSRGFPTLKAKVVLSDGSMGEAAVPSGASTGSHEALELRDGDERFGGKGVLKAIKNVGEIKKILVGKDFKNIREIDKAMLILDGTTAKTHLGANAILSVSMAVLRAGAVSEDLPLYEYIRKVFDLKERNYLLSTPMLNIVNGGKHADSGLSVQEFMIVPEEATSFKECLRGASETYHCLKEILADKGLSTSVGDEGGFAPKIKNHEEVLQIILEAAKKAGYPKMKLALDCAASEFYKEGYYYFEGKRNSYKEMTDIYATWCEKYPLISIEDPLEEDDWSAWQYFTKTLGGKINIVGDDLFVTNKNRLKEGILNEAANSILIKLNQIGSVSETIDVIYFAKQAGYSTIISHRSGETEDTFIADLAVAVNAGAIKTGAPTRGERTAKYNRLLEIEEELGKKAKYAKGICFKK